MTNVFTADALKDQRVNRVRLALLKRSLRRVERAKALCLT